MFIAVSPVCKSSEGSIVSLSLKPTTSPFANRRRRRAGPPNRSAANNDGGFDDDDADYDHEDSLASTKEDHTQRQNVRSSIISASPGRSSASSCKHVADVPVTSFDPFLVDSDADTVTSRDVRRQFRSAVESGPKLKGLF